MVYLNCVEKIYEHLETLQLQYIAMAVRSYYIKKCYYSVSFSIRSTFRHTDIT